MTLIINLKITRSLIIVNIKHKILISKSKVFVISIVSIKIIVIFLFIDSILIFIDLTIYNLTIINLAVVSSILIDTNYINIDGSIIT